MQGEVPIGVLLSGGMDSSSIVAVMSKHWDAPVHTFTVGFGEASDETSDARRTAEHFGTVHHELAVRSDSLQFAPRAIWHMDEPRRNIEPTFLIAQAAKPHVKVLHSGLGGDELFIGYDRDLRLARTKDLPAKVPAPLRKVGARLPMPTDKLERMRDFATSHGDAAKTFLAFAPTAPLSGREQAAILEPRFADGKPGVAEAYRPYFADLQGVDFGDAALVVQLRTYMAEDTLEIVDRQLAANGIEGRVPFCNRSLVELAFRIPLGVRAAERKHVLRKPKRRILPAEVAERRAKGVFGMRSSTWFQGALRDTAAMVLTPERLRARGVVQPAWVERMVARPYDPQRERAYTHLWNVLAFELFHAIYFEQSDVRRPELRLDAIAS
jgi:asparagine synthase (glutamine-hydrolysing)